MKQRARSRIAPPSMLRAMPLPMLLLLLLCAPANHSAAAFRPADELRKLVDRIVGPSASAPPPADVLGLLGAAVVFRHGARTPLSSLLYSDVEWRCDDEAGMYGGPDLVLRDASPGAPPGAPPPPVIDEDVPRLPGGCRAGTLTKNGFAMAVALGERLRRRYVEDLKLLPAGRFEEGMIKAHTTMYRRTQQTLRVRVRCVPRVFFSLCCVWLLLADQQGGARSCHTNMHSF